MDMSWDAIVIGGGGAGLSAALVLVRARRRVLVLDAARPRNRFAAHMHAVLGHDGRPPGALLAEGRSEIQRYGGVVRPASVASVSRDDSGFAVSTEEGGRYAGRRLVVATGMRDELPDLPGLREQWGRGVVVCPYCDGYEVRDGRIGILATGPRSVFQAQLLRQWSGSITYLADALGAPTGEDLAGFRARGIEIVEGPVARVIADADDVLRGVALADGTSVELDRIFLIPRFVPLDEPLVQLGAAREDTPWGSFVKVDSTGGTSVEGAWAAGNVTNPAASVPIAVGAEALVGGTVNHDLVLADVADALQAHAEVAAPLSVPGAET